MLDTLREWSHHLPHWLNLKVCGAVILIGGGLWLFFKALGESVKLLIALALVGAGALIIAKVLNWI